MFKIPGDFKPSLLLKILWYVSDMLLVIIVTLFTLFMFELIFGV